MNTILIIAIIFVVLLMLNEKFKFLTFRIRREKPFVVDLVSPGITENMDYKNARDQLLKVFNTLSSPEKSKVELFLLLGTYNHVKKELCKESSPTGLHKVISHCRNLAGENFTKYLIVNTTHLIHVSKKNNLNISDAIDVARFKN